MSKYLRSLLFLLSLTCFETASGINSTGSTGTVSFLQNKGQWNEQILFHASTGNTNIQLLKNAISFSQVRGDIDENEGQLLVWNMQFLNASSILTISGNGGKPTVHHYLSGNDPSKWIHNPVQYESVTYNNIYKNTDLHIYGDGKNLKYDYILHPGAGINSITSTYAGVNKLYIDANGDLEVHTPWSIQIQKAPVSWQLINGSKKNVKIRYTLLNDTTFGFTSAGYNPDFDLVIDPLFEMVWSSYTQATGVSNNINYCFANAMDKDGNVYLTGFVDDTFPITPGAYSGPGTIVPEIFVAKFSSDGTTMLYSTYLPGNSSEFGSDIAVDDSGRAYVTGVVDLNFTGITDFPSTPNAYQPVHNTGSDAFLTVLTADGSGLVYSTFLGGTGSETGYGVVVTSPGIAYVTGNTTNNNFPVVNAAPVVTGDNDAFVAKLDINQSGTASLLYSLHIGAGQFNSVSGRSIAVNSAGNVFITGSVFNSFGTINFPVTPGAYSTVYNSGSDNMAAYVLKLSATTPVSIDYATYIGPGIGNGVTVHDATNEAIVTGATNTFTFPVSTGALQGIHGQDASGNGNSDAFVMRLNATGTGIIYSTFLGGPLQDIGQGVAVNSAGEAYVSGMARQDFPTSPGAYQETNAGSFDFFVVHINPAGTAYACGGSTYVGGADEDYTGSFYDYPAPKISLIDNGGVNDTVSVSATTHSINFPTTPGVYGPVKVNSIADQPVFFKLSCTPAGVPPDAAFNITVTPGCNSVNVNFNDSSSNNPTSWQWTFQGGTPSTSTVQNPQGIVFTVSNSYTTTLVACNSFGCDSTSQIIQILVPQNIPVNLGNDTTVCNGATVTLSATPGLASYSWQLNGSNTGNNQATLNVTQPGIYTVTVIDTLGCTGADTIVVNGSNPTVSIGPDLILCNNDSVLINATPGFASYQWLLNGSLLGSTTENIVAVQPGFYVVIIEDSSGCSASDTLTATASIINLAAIADTAICTGNNFIADAGTGFSGYQWQLNGVNTGSSNTLTISQPGTYSVTVTNSEGCTATENFIVTVNQLPVIQTINDITICNGTSVQLVTTGAQTYLWNPSTFLSSATVPDPLASPQNNISYIVTGTDANGCSSSDSVNVSITERPVAQFDFTTQYGCFGIIITTQNKSQLATEYLWDFGDGSTSAETNPVHVYADLTNQTIQLVASNGACADTSELVNLASDLPVYNIPNIVTANGDGKNDCLHISGTENFRECYSLKIFNRWGNSVFQTDKADNCWAGKDDDNNELPAAVYFYILEIKDLILKGSVHLIR
jgi:gliding motility-associated-like protein